jgi:hypothetical protein
MHKLSHSQTLINPSAYVSRSFEEREIILPVTIPQSVVDSYLYKPSSTATSIKKPSSTESISDDLSNKRRRSPEVVLPVTIPQSVVDSYLYKPSSTTTIKKPSSTESISDDLTKTS